MWVRECKNCGRKFNALTKWSRVCEWCKKKSRERILEGYYKKYEERFWHKYQNRVKRRSKKNGDKRMDAKKN